MSACPKGHRQLWLGDHYEPCRTCAREAAMLNREGAGEPHAWFCYLWHDYVPGSKTQSANVMLASCRRCGHVMPRDEERRNRPCKGVVRVELRGAR